MWLLFSAYEANPRFAHDVWTDKRGVLISMFAAPFEIKFPLILLLSVLFKPL